MKEKIGGTLFACFIKKTLIWLHLHDSFQSGKLKKVLFSLLFALITGYWKWNISYKTTDFALLKGILLNALVYVHDLFIPTD